MTKNLIQPSIDSIMSSKIILPIVLVILILLVGVGVYASFANLNPLKEKTSTSTSSISISLINSKRPVLLQISTAKSSITKPLESDISTKVPELIQNPLTSTVNATSNTKTFSVTELATHSSETDCYVSVLNKVYNVTAYISQHPGGNDILKGCGKVLDNVRHPGGSFTGPQIQAILKDYYLGELK